VKATAKSFVGGAFALIALFLVLAHAGGFAQVIGAGAGGSSNVFKTLQGR
jgi:hypothetical protein